MHTYIHTYIYIYICLSICACTYANVYVERTVFGVCGEGFGVYELLVECFGLLGLGGLAGCLESRGTAELESSKVSHFNHRVMVNVSES